MPVVALVMLALPCEAVDALAVVGMSAAIRAMATAPVKRRAWNRDVGVTAIDLVRGARHPPFLYRQGATRS